MGGAKICETEKGEGKKKLFRVGSSFIPRILYVVQVREEYKKNLVRITCLVHFCTP